MGKRPEGERGSCSACGELRCSERESSSGLDQDQWRAVVTNRMEQRTEADVNDKPVQTEGQPRLGQQIMESEGVLTAVSALFLFFTGEESEAQSRKVTCPSSNPMLVVGSRVELWSSGFPVLSLFYL